jgi:hypothetical protein
MGDGGPCHACPCCGRKSALLRSVVADADVSFLCKVAATAALLPLTAYVEAQIWLGQHGLGTDVTLGGPDGPEDFLFMLHGHITYMYLCNTRLRPWMRDVQLAYRCGGSGVKQQAASRAGIAW